MWWEAKAVQVSHLLNLSFVEHCQGSHISAVLQRVKVWTHWIILYESKGSALDFIQPGEEGW